ncbi:NAD(P)/FAD-dependent oxidoreductase [soil metagenome]
MPKLGKSPVGAQLREIVSLADAANQLDEQRGTSDSSASIEEVLSRRAALRLAAVGAAVGLAGGALAKVERFLEPGATPKDVRVAIVGGGIAGLSAAYHLKRAGIRAQVYEAQSRIGGRIFSRYDMGPGLTTEVGASFIDSTHTDMLRLAKTFDLSMWDTMAKSEEKLQPAYFFGGKMRLNNEVLAAIKPFVARIKYDQNHAVANSHKDFNALAGKLDHISTKDYLQKLGVKDWLYDFLDVALMTENGTEIDKLSALQCFGELGTNRTGPYELFAYSDQRYATNGGNHQIPQGLADAVADQIHLGQWLESVRKDSSGAYELTFKTSGGTQTVKADYVIMTVPFKILRDLDFDVPLSLKKKQAIKELNYGYNCKLVLGFKDRFWRSQGTTGLFFTDLPIQSGWDSGWMQPTVESNLTLFFGGQAAIDQVGLPIEARVEQYLPQVDLMFPGAAKKFTGKRTQFNWPHFKYIRASYSAYSTGQQTTFGGIERVPEGRMFFAGEHCDPDDQGFMNGGAKTGRLAAAALAKAIR